MGEQESKAFHDEVGELPSVDVDLTTAQDVANIAHGVLSPLEGFMDQGSFLGVLEHSRLPGDVPWTIPIVLDLPDGVHPELKAGDTLALAHEGAPMAAMAVSEVYAFDPDLYAKGVFGTLDAAHPGVANVKALGGRLVAGKISMASEPESPFPKFTLWPIETRVLFKAKGWNSVVAFQTRNPPHLGHEYVQKTALTFTDGLFINPIIGKKKRGDFTDEVIISTYAELIEHYYLRNSAVLGVLQAEMRYGGPREAILHAIMRKNFGCTHFIVGRDHAGVGKFYPPYAAQEIFAEFPDLGIAPVFFRSFFYCKRCGSIANEKTCPHSGDAIVDFSGTKIRNLLAEGHPPGEDMMRAEVSDIILRSPHPFVE
jgi:sulfate adenylyltransferase